MIIASSKTHSDSINRSSRLCANWTTFVVQFHHHARPIQHEECARSFLRLLLCASLVRLVSGRCPLASRNVRRPSRCSSGAARVQRGLQGAQMSHTHKAGVRDTKLACQLWRELDDEEAASESETTTSSSNLQSGPRRQAGQRQGHGA